MIKHIKIVSLFPNYFDSFFKSVKIKRGIEKQIVKFDVLQLRDYSNLKNKQVDEYVYGGNAGMILRCEPIDNCLKSEAKNFYKIILSPQGKLLDQKKLVELSKKDNLLIFCANYEGYDARVSTLFDEEISIGDFVITSGESACCVIVEGIVRNYQNIISEQSLKSDSFGTKYLLENPQYTKPIEFNGMKVPEVYLSGNHQEIEKYAKKAALINTYEKRPDLIEKYFEELSPEEKKLIAELKKKHVVNSNN